MIASMPFEATRMFSKFGPDSVSSRSTSSKVSRSAKYSGSSRPMYSGRWSAYSSSNCRGETGASSRARPEPAVAGAFVGLIPSTCFQGEEGVRTGHPGRAGERNPDCNHGGVPCLRSVFTVGVPARSLILVSAADP